MSPVNRAPAYRTARPRSPRAPLAAVLSVLLLVGCGAGDRGLGEKHAQRLTEGKGLKEFPCFSPDGELIAYTVGTAEREFDYIVRIVPVEGGPSRDLTENDVPQVCLGWPSDGRGIFTLNIWDSSLRLVAPDGSVLARYSSDGMSEPVAVSPAGDRFLYRRSNGDNIDLGMRTAGKSGFKFLAETPEWEVDGCFGPGRSVTAVRRETAWAEESEIAVWSPDTREYEPVSLPGSRNIDPAWSGDGRFLAYASDEFGDFDIWVHDRDSRRALRVTSGPADDRYPSWSPDGSRLAFCRWTVVSHVFSRDMASDEVRQLTAGHSRDRFPTTSPDGQWVVFARTRTPADLPRNPVLCVASTSGGPIRQLDTRTLRPRLDRGGVCWSPNSAEIAFSADDGSGNLDIYRVSREGGAPARVTIRQGTDLDPSWSPDGATIAYARGRDNETETEIWTIPATGGMATRVSSSPGVNGGAVWSPDADRIVHYSYTNAGTGGTDLWLSYASRPGRSELLFRDGTVNVPLAWSEDGRTVLFRKDEIGGTSLWAIPLDDRTPERIGERMRGETAGGDRFRLNEAGRRYLERLFPGGIQTTAEGEDIGDIYVIEISDLLRTRF